MFTGIVEYVGRIESVDATPDLTRFRIDVGPVAEGVKLGDSVAVSGCCLTVTAIDGSRLDFEAVRETLETTRLAALSEGDGVNLERAMAATARFDGHIVQGHVDGQGRVRRLERKGAEGNEVELHVECASSLAYQLVDKGSVTIDGVSVSYTHLTLPTKA